MNTYRKGLRIVRKGREELEKQGYLTAKVESVGKYIRNKDLFGLFDVIAIKSSETKLIQFKTNAFPKITPFMQFALIYPQFKVEIWCWKDNNGWEIKEIKGQL